jgi:hypothetical protein
MAALKEDLGFWIPQKVFDADYPITFSERDCTRLSRILAICIGFSGIAFKGLSE